MRRRTKKITIKKEITMTVVRTLGKNTLGDNNKMKVAMRNYDFFFIQQLN